MPSKKNYARNYSNFEVTFVREYLESWKSLGKSTDNFDDEENQKIKWNDILRIELNKWNETE